MIIAVFDGQHGQRVRAFENAHAAEEWRQHLARQHWAFVLGVVRPMPSDPKEAADFFFATDMHWFQTHEEVRLEFSFQPDELDEVEVMRPITIAETLRKRLPEPTIPQAAE